MRLLAPEFLWLLPAAALFAFVPRRVRDLPHVLLRALALVLIVFALARPVRPTTDARPYHVLVVDGSASAAESEVGRARALLARRLATLPADARIGWIELGPPPVPEIVDPAGRLFARARIGESDLGAALRQAARWIPAGARGAVTLASDGLATREGFGAALAALEARGIPLHVLPLAAPENDVRVVALRPLDTPRVGRTTRVAVDVAGGPARVAVRLEGPKGELARREGVVLEKRTRVVLTFEPESAGFLPVAATVVAEQHGDARPGDERLERTLGVCDPLRVLYVGERLRGGAERLAQLVGPGFDVRARPPEQARAELGQADLLVVDDCPAERLGAGFQREIVDAVERRGLGLFLSGGRAAFGPGGYHDQPLEELMPVELVQKEEKRDPSTTLVVIIDTSGSMSGERVQLAKEVARLAIRRLLPHDKVGIVEFYGAKRWAAPIQPASNRIELERALNRLDAGGGTVILPAIEEAFYAMQNVQSRYKHVLVLTDGGVESGDFESLLRRMADKGMNVSTVLVGGQAHSEFLVNLANWGKGRFYAVPNRFNLPEILLKQPASAKLPGYRPEVTPVTARGGGGGGGGGGWWGDLDPATVPALAGFCETRARPGAERVLETRLGAHPILASWRYGLGRVSAFTSEPTGAGTASWGEWSGYGRWLARVLERTADDSGSPFSFRAERRDRVLVVTAERLVSEPLVPAARVTDGEKAPRELGFVERAPGWFEARAAWPPALPARLECGVRSAPEAPPQRLALDPASDVRPELQVDPRERVDLVRAAVASGGRVLGAGELEAGGKAGLPVGGGGGTRGLADLTPLAFLGALLAYLFDLWYRRRPRRRAVP